MVMCAQSRADMATSDSLFASGVGLYQQGKYKDAIPLFKESDRIDKARLDETSNRRHYSAMNATTATTTPKPSSIIQKQKRQSVAYWTTVAYSTAVTRYCL